jgi:DNA mismatch endonuclease (patch repair protein)
MASIRSTDTTPEMTLRRALWSRGCRYRTYYGPEKIDIAFPAKKVAVFVDGCFWHGCPEHSHKPKSNEGYWHLKLDKNIKRDLANTKKLESKGWRVLRFWEHELKNADMATFKILSVLREHATKN